MFDTINNPFKDNEKELDGTISNIYEVYIKVK